MLYEELLAEFNKQFICPYSYNKRSTKMIVNTDYKTFSNQTSALWNGNAVTSTQYSNYIRANEGIEIFEYDLKLFDLTSQARHLTEMLYRQGKNFYLYQYHVYNQKTKEKQVIGWLYYSEDNKEMYFSLVNEYYIGTSHYNKKLSVLNTCQSIIRYLTMWTDYYQKNSYKLD